MSERRQQVLDAIQRAAGPVGVSEIADRVGVHPNTVRFHLEALLRDGVVERVPDTPSGPGRPRAGYRPRPGLARGGARRYRAVVGRALGTPPGIVARKRPRHHPRRGRRPARGDTRRPGLRPRARCRRTRPTRPDPPATLPLLRTRRATPRPRLPPAPRPDAGRTDRAPRAGHDHSAGPLRRAQRVPGPPHATPRAPRETVVTVSRARTGGRRRPRDRAARRGRQRRH